MTGVYEQYQRRQVPADADHVARGLHPVNTVSGLPPQSQPPSVLNGSNSVETESPVLECSADGGTVGDVMREQEQEELKKLEQQEEQEQEQLDKVVPIQGSASYFLLILLKP